MKKDYRAVARLLTLARLLSLGFVLAIPAVAQAGPILPAAKYQGYAFDPGSNATLNGPGSASNGYTDPSGGLDSSSYGLSLAGTPNPTASAGIVFTYTPYTDVGASAGLVYYMEIIDSTSSASHNPVTADVMAFVSASSLQDGVGGAAFEIQQTSYISGSTVCSEGAPCLVQSWAACAAQDPFLCAPGAPVSVAVNTTESLFSNTEYTVQLGTSANPNPFALDNPSGTASGFVDPGFGIDPTTLDARDYSFIFSAGIGNPGTGSVASSVPEPPTLALFGFALIGLVAMRARVSTRNRSRSLDAFAPHRMMNGASGIAT